MSATQQGANGAGQMNAASAPAATSSQPGHNGSGGVTLSPDEIAALRALLDRVTRDAS